MRTVTDDLQSLPGVADVHRLRGAAARPHAPPDLLLEVPHGATRAADFHAIRSLFRGPCPADLSDFFFVNTDVGAPELAARIAERVVEADPSRTALVIRSRIPRTFVDCNRVIAPDAAAKASKPGETTPGLMPWVVDAEDRALLLSRYAAYRDLVERAVELVLGGGGIALMVHTYAPRSVDVAVDERIVERLREAYREENLPRWPLRPEVDLIVRDPAGRFLADETLVSRVRASLSRVGIVPAEAATYALHPDTLAARFAARFPGRTLCFEVRRDLLVREFTPFSEMVPDAAAVDRLATPFAAALAGGCGGPAGPGRMGA